jgi:hypothetical protein
MGSKFKCKSFHSFDEISASLKTGDIFLAHGDSLISHLIEDLTWSEWSHSGMVVLADDIGLTGLPTNILLWESTHSTDLPDIVTGCYKKNHQYKDHPGGTFLVSLSERIRNDIKIKETPVAIRHLKVERTPEMFSALKKTTDEVRAAYFPNDRQFVEDFFRGRVEKKEPSSWDHIFCSELVAYTLMNMGILSREAHVPNYYEPKSYSTENKNGLLLLKGATLEPEICIDRIS